MAKEKNSVFSEKGFMEKMDQGNKLLEKGGDLLTRVAYMGYKEKELAKAEMNTPIGRILMTSVGAVALLTPVSVPSFLGVASVGAVYIGINKLIKDSLTRESAKKLATSYDAEGWKLFSETKNVDVINSLINGPGFLETHMLALSRNKNTSSDNLSKIYARLLSVPDVNKKTPAGMNKIKEALLENVRTPNDIKEAIRVSDTFIESPRSGLSKEQEKSIDIASTGIASFLSDEKKEATDSTAPTTPGVKA